MFQGIHGEFFVIYLGTKSADYGRRDTWLIIFADMLNHCIFELPTIIMFHVLKCALERVKNR